jgi:hypothetical protein
MRPFSSSGTYTKSATKTAAFPLVVHKEDGVKVYYDVTPVAYFHFRQNHILVHAAPGYTEAM